jgi:1-acyl-sn-glycerol-3-phosphate acyltransferase
MPCVSDPTAGDQRPEARQARRLSAAYRLAEVVVRPLLTMVTRRHWRGGEYLPRAEGFVAVGNHVSHVDPFTFAQFLFDNGCPPRFLGKQSVFEIPVLGRIVRGAGQIPVQRETMDAGKALSAAMDAVRAGECVAIYPEATLTRDPGLWPMAGKTGAARIALATGCPVIPIAQWGPERILAPYAKRPKVFPRTDVHVWAGPPVDLSAFSGAEPSAAVLTAATAAIMAAITGLEQIRGEPAPVERWDPRTHDLPRTGNPRSNRRTPKG